MSEPIVLGTGRLSWNADERRTDRYGSVRLHSADPEGADDVLLTPEADALEGTYGELVARVVGPADSPHVGDWARGFRPSRPDAGETRVLGTGHLFVEHVGRGVPHEPGEHELKDKKLMEAVEAEFRQFAARTDMSLEIVNGMLKGVESAHDLVGVKPVGGRPTDWLDPQALYRFHFSVVELTFRPLPDPAPLGWNPPEGVEETDPSA